jgi:hypothetical protein
MAWVVYAPGKEQVMLWFKHSQDLRNSPAMKYIQRKLGDEGFAAAIRLIEVLTYRSGSGSRFNPILTLSPPTSELWLAQEILTYDENDPEANPVNTLHDFLNHFQSAGLIVCGDVEGSRPVQTTDGWEYKSCKWLTVQLVEFEEFMDVWTKRVSEGRPGAHSTKA